MAKFLKNSSGGLAEEATVGTSAGAGDAGKVVHLNGSGVLDSTIVNSKNTSAGAGDAGKIPALNASGVLDSTIVNSTGSSAGAGDSGKLPSLDGSGKLDSTFMPVGVGADTDTIQASENIAAGDWINVHNSSGPRVRKADATTAGKEAHGFVLSAISSGASGTVYFDGANTAVTSKTPGAMQYLGTTAGTSTETPPSGSGNVVQRLGVARSATKIDTALGTPIVLV